MFDLLATPKRRKFLFALLYLSEGAPIGFIWWALPTRLRLAGVPVAEIAMLSGMLVLPWTFKFLWAPLVDALQSRRWTLRHWIVAAQTLMGVSLLPLFRLNFDEHFHWLAAILLIHAVAAATQDVAIDALCIRVTHPDERGRLNGWMQAGMLLGRAGLGGGALMLAGVIGEAGVVALLIAVIWSSLIVLMLTRWPAELIAKSTSTLRDTLRQLIASASIAASQRNTWFALAFALVGGAAYEGLGVIAGPLLVDQGVRSEDIGYFFGAPVLLATIFGSLAGGRMADTRDRRVSVATSMLIIVVFAALAGLSVADLDILPTAPTARNVLLVCSLTGVYFGIGLFTACSYALFMDVTTPAVAATQFSAFMGATNGCEAASAQVIGRIVNSNGYTAGIWLMCLPSLAALLLLRWIVPRKEIPEGPTSSSRRRVLSE